MSADPTPKTTLLSRWLPTPRELLAAVGVIASLAFVGLEVRQNTIALRGQTRDSLARAGEDWLMSIAAEGELSEAMASVERNEEMSPTDTVRARFALVALARHHENVFLQVREGTVDESGLLGYGWITSTLYSTSFFTELWPGVSAIFNPDFVEAHERAFSNLRRP